MKRETLDRFIRREVTLKFIDGEIAHGTLEYDEYHSNRYILKRPTEDSDIVFPQSLVRSIIKGKIMSEDEKKKFIDGIFDEVEKRKSRK